MMRDVAVENIDADKGFGGKKRGAAVLARRAFYLELGITDK